MNTFSVPSNYISASELFVRWCGCDGPPLYKIIQSNRTSYAPFLRGFSCFKAKTYDIIEQNPGPLVCTLVCAGDFWWMSVCHIGWRQLAVTIGSDGYVTSVRKKRG